MESRLFDYCNRYNKDKVLEILNTNITTEDLNQGLAGACAGGHKDLAMLMIKKGANDWYQALEQAYKHKYEDIIILLINTEWK